MSMRTVFVCNSTVWFVEQHWYLFSYAKKLKQEYCTDPLCLVLASELQWTCCFSGYWKIEASKLIMGVFHWCASVQCWLIPKLCVEMNQISVVGLLCLCGGSIKGLFRFVCELQIFMQIKTIALFDWKLLCFIFQGVNFGLRVLKVSFLPILLVYFFIHLGVTKPVCIRNTS